MTSKSKVGEKTRTESTMTVLVVYVAYMGEREANQTSQAAGSNGRLVTQRGL